MERTVIRDRRGDHDENVERQSDGGDSDDDRGDRQIDGPEVPREGIPEEKQSRLEHQGETLHHEIELPRDHSAEFALTVSAFVNFGTPHFGLSEAIQPLFAQHGEEGGEERNAEACIEDGLTGDDFIIRTVPGLERGWLAVERGTIHLVNQNAEESGCLLIIVRFKLILDVDDETRGHG